jgi:myosin heavy subunit
MNAFLRTALLAVAICRLELKIATAIALLGLAGCAEYDDPLEAQLRAHMLQSQQDTQYMVDQYKAEIARIDKQQKELDKISDYYATDIERMRKDSEQMDKYKAELERYSRFLDKLQEQENQDQQQQQQPAPQKPNPQSI